MGTAENGNRAPAVLYCPHLGSTWCRDPMMEGSPQHSIFLPHSRLGDGSSLTPVLHSTSQLQGTRVAGGGWADPTPIPATALQLESVQLGTFPCSLAFLPAAWLGDHPSPTPVPNLASQPWEGEWRKPGCRVKRPCYRVSSPPSPPRTVETPDGAVAGAGGLCSSPCLCIPPPLQLRERGWGDHPALLQKGKPDCREKSPRCGHPPLYRPHLEGVSRAGGSVFPPQPLPPLGKPRIPGMGGSALTAGG